MQEEAVDVTESTYYPLVSGALRPYMNCLNCFTGKNEEEDSKAGNRSPKVTFTCSLKAVTRCPGSTPSEFWICLLNQVAEMALLCVKSLQRPCLRKRAGLGVHLRTMHSEKKCSGP